MIATREGRVDDSVQCFQEALRLNPHHLLSLDNLGNAYRSQKRWDEARKVLERALEVAPQDPEANYSLGMVFAQTDDTDKAYEYLQRALKARPVYPEALNNLGVLYLVTQRRDQAVASFEAVHPRGARVRSGVSESGARLCAGRRAGQGSQRVARSAQAASRSPAGEADARAIAIVSHGFGVGAVSRSTNIL